MYLKQKFASKGPVQKAMGQRYFGNFLFSWDLSHVFLAEFGKTYIIFIEIRHGICSLFSHKYWTTGLCIEHGTKTF